MLITQCYLQTTPYLHGRKHSPGGATMHIRIANAWVQLTPHLSTPRRWVAELAMLADTQRTVHPEEVSRQLHVMAQARESSPVIDRRSNYTHCATPRWPWSKLHWARFGFEAFSNCVSFLWSKTTLYLKNANNFTFEYLSQTSNAFNSFWYTKFWVHCALKGLWIFYFTCKMSLHHNTNTL